MFAARLELIYINLSPFPCWIPRSTSSRRESNLASATAQEGNKGEVRLLHDLKLPDGHRLHGDLIQY